MVFWNSLDIPQPPTNVCKVSTGVFRKMDLLNLKSTISSASITLNELSQLHVEAALLSRTLYKNKISFRNHKGFKKLERVNRGLLRYLAFDLKMVYAKFARMLPDHSEEFEFALPTKQMLEWVLVRTQGFAKLFCVIADSCEETSCFWKTNIQRGEVFNVSLLFLGIVSRIWSYSRYLVQNACKWFSELRTYLTVLEYSGMAWLPQSYEIPQDLAVWLKSHHTKSIPLTVNMQKNSDGKHLFDFIELEDGDSPELNRPSLDDNDNKFPFHSDDEEKPTSLMCQHNIRKPLSVDLPRFSKGSLKPLSLVDKEDFSELMHGNALLSKKKVLPLVNSGPNAGVKVSNAFKEIKKKFKKGKKRRHDGSLQVVSSLESGFNTEFLEEVQGNKQNLNECSSIPETKKSKKLKKLEILTNSKIDTSRKTAKKRKRKQQKLQEDNVDLHIFQNEVSQPTSSRKKRKKKSKTDQHNSLFNALAGNKINSLNSKVPFNQLTKSTKKKKKKRKNKEPTIVN